MKQKIKNWINYFALLLALALPFKALAQTSAVQQGLDSSGLQSSFGTSGLLGARNATDLIARVIKLLLLFTAAIAILFIIIGGYQYITSAGNEESAEKGRKTLVNAVIGLAIIVMSYAIVNVVTNQLLL